MATPKSSPSLGPQVLVVCNWVNEGYWMCAAPDYPDKMINLLGVPIGNKDRLTGGGVIWVVHVYAPRLGKEVNPIEGYLNHHLGEIIYNF